MKKTTVCIRTIRNVLALLILAPLLFAAVPTDTLGAGSQASGSPVRIGIISAKYPTVSSLLLQNPRFKTKCWEIIKSEQNRDKNFAGVKTGTEIYYNPATKELLWADATSKTAPTAVMPVTTFKFPTVVEGENITHDFIIQNRGEGDLTVLGVKTS